VTREVGKSRFESVPVDALVIGEYGPRKRLSESSLEVLRRSIREEGILVPLVVVPEGTKFRVVCGKRRAMCASSLGMATVPVLVYEASAGFELWAAIAENELREPLNVVEVGEYIASMMAALPYTEAEIAQELGVSQSWVSQRLAILRWPDSLRSAVAGDKLSFSVGRELAGISDEKELAQCVWQAVSGGCTVRQAADWRREWEQRSHAAAESKPAEIAAEPGPVEAANPADCFMCAGAAGSKGARNVVLCDFCHKALVQARSTTDAPS